jgi:hypothetical protein
MAEKNFADFGTTWRTQRLHAIQAWGLAARVAKELGGINRIISSENIGSNFAQIVMTTNFLEVIKIATEVIDSCQYLDGGNYHKGNAATMEDPQEFMAVAFWALEIQLGNSFAAVQPLLNMWVAAKGIIDGAALKLSELPQTQQETSFSGA